MPETGPARKTATTGTAKRKVTREAGSHDIDKKVSSFHEAATVQDRVRLWQTQNNVATVDPDLLSVKSCSRSDLEACRTPQPPPSPIPHERQQNEADTAARRRSMKWVQQENTKWVKKRKSVSHNQQRDTNRVLAEETPSIPEYSAKDKFEPIAPTYLRSESQRTRNVNSSRAEREDRRKRRREVRARANGGAALVDDGIRVYMRSESHLASEPAEFDESPARSLKGLEEYIDDENQSAPSLKYHGSVRSDTGDTVGEEPRFVQPSKYAQILGQAPAAASVLDQPKARKRALFSKTKEMLIGKHEAPPALSNRVSSIEAWLDEQPGVSNPSFDDQEIITPLPSDIPKPLKHQSNRKKVSIEPTIPEIDDPNKIWDSITPPRPAKERKRNINRRNPKNRSLAEVPSSSRRLFSFEVCETPSKGEECLPVPPAEETRVPPESRTRDGKFDQRKSDEKVGAVQEAPSTQPLARENSIQPERDISPKKIGHSVRNETIQEDPVRGETALDEGGIGTRLHDKPSGLPKRKLTTHEDLISVLSQARPRKSTRSLRSAAQTPGLINEHKIRDAIRAMKDEETKYTRELKTLVDGVTPVLLQSLLSRTDATATVGLFSENGPDAACTRPIIDMGVALQRLKNLHQRAKFEEQNIEGLLIWATTAHKSYTDYVKSWRLGFQGIIVNLAPLDESTKDSEDMLARDVDGDITDEKGQKVDVAYLQKRPLIRIRRLAKLFATIKEAKPTHEKAAKIAEMFEQLMETAKQRHSDEQGRLEDEAAANIDTSRARDIKTMAPLQSVNIERSRKVRARDYFDLSIYHSTGQRLDCRIEIILRDDPTATNTGGDILICQIEEDTRWLLFQPLNLCNISIRKEHVETDLLLMVQGAAGIGQSWLELIALRAEDAAAATEWLHMVGSNPLPPKSNHVPSWHTPQEPPHQAQQIQTPTPLALNAAALANLPSDIDVPIGEPSVVLKYKPGRSSRAQRVAEQKAPAAPQKLSMGGGLRQKIMPDHYRYGTVDTQQQASPVKASPTSSSVNELSFRPRASSKPAAIGIPTPSVTSSNISHEALFTQQRYSPQKFSHIGTASAAMSTESYPTRSDVSSARLSSVHLGQAETSYEQSLIRETVAVPLIASRDLGTAGDRDSTQHQRIDGAAIQDREQTVRQSSPHPISESPKPSFKPLSKPSSTTLTNDMREKWAVLSGIDQRPSSPSTLSTRKPLPQTPVIRELPMLPKPQDITKQEGFGYSSKDSAPPPPAHNFKHTRFSSPHGSRTALAEITAPTWQSRTTNIPPTTHRYHQSSSASSTQSDDDDDTDATSELSDVDHQSEMKDQSTPLVAIGQSNRRPLHGPARPLPTIPTGTATLDPSDSASNGPYRKAPPPAAFPAHKKRRTIAMICSWSDRGVWEPIKDEECSVVISPGLVQAFPMTAAHSQPMTGADWEIENEGDQPITIEQTPLVEFELTPVVPLRKGTALDITIRSPPTSNSTIRTTNNVMFRSRTVQECEKLYQLINWARCNNPTYAQLAQSRAQQDPITFASNVEQSRTRSWFSFGSRQKGSYRATSKPPTSIADSAASGSSATSAFSALKKFGMNSSFSLKRSSVLHQSGDSIQPTSLYSSSQGGSGSGSSTPAPPSQAGFIPGREGPNVPQTSAEAVNGGGMVNNMKVRLFVRQGQKWEALGQSLLTVLPAANVHGSSAATPDLASSSPRSRPPSAMPQSRDPRYRLSSSGSTPHRIHGDGREKRILVTALKRRETVLLDEVLGESCFEKVMQTGVAINVWKEEDQVQKYGGVMTGRSKTYMIQFRTSTEASWVFNMCGSYRYGIAQI